MAKKKSRSVSESPEGSLPRKGDVTPEELRRRAEELKSLSGRMLAIAKLFEENGVISASVDGVQKFPRAVGLFEDYMSAVEYWMKRAKTKR